MPEEEHDGASVKEQLVAACRGNNTELLTEILADRPDEEITKLLNETTTVLGNHLYHEAALRGNYEIIDLLLDQPDFECDPITRLDADTPLHSAIRWLNSEPVAQRPFGLALIEMMLEAGSNPRQKNKGGITPFHLVDPGNTELRDLIRKFEFATQNSGDYVNVEQPKAAQGIVVQDDESDDDAEFSGSDEEERAEWERRRSQKMKA